MLRRISGVGIGRGRTLLLLQKIANLGAYLFSATKQDSVGPSDSILIISQLSLSFAVFALPVKGQAILQEGVVIRVSRLSQNETTKLDFLK